MSLGTNKKGKALFIQPLSQNKYSLIEDRSVFNEVVAFYFKSYLEFEFPLTVTDNQQL